MKLQKGKALKNLNEKLLSQIVLQSRNESEYKKVLVSWNEIIPLESTTMLE